MHDVLEWGQNIPKPIKVGNLDYKANVTASNILVGELELKSRI